MALGMEATGLWNRELEVLNEKSPEVWSKLEFVIDIDESRPFKEGTELAIRRV